MVKENSTDLVAYLLIEAWRRSADGLQAQFYLGFVLFIYLFLS